MSSWPFVIQGGQEQNLSIHAAIVEDSLATGYLVVTDITSYLKVDVDVLRKGFMMLKSSIKSEKQT